jgi:hypothetical protein
VLRAHLHQFDEHKERARSHLGKSPQRSFRASLEGATSQRHESRTPSIVAVNACATIWLRHATIITTTPGFLSSRPGRSWWIRLPSTDTLIQRLSTVCSRRGDKPAAKVAPRGRIHMMVASIASGWPQDFRTPQGPHDIIPGPEDNGL